MGNPRLVDGRTPDQSSDRLPEVPVPRGRSGAASPPSGDPAAKGPDISQAVLDSLPYETAIINRNGCILAMNAAWSEAATRSGSPSMTGGNYLDALRRLGTKWAMAALEGIEAVLAGHLPDFQMEYEYQEGSATKTATRARSANVAPLRTSSGGAIIYQIDITWRKNLERQLSRRATHDALTELPNRTMLGDRLREALVRASRRNAQVAVIFCDIDRFKDVNDTLGHAVGDRVLQAVAQRLRACCRREDWLVRFGGDEFVILVEDIPDELSVIALAERIRSGITKPLVIGGRELYFGVSVGVAIHVGVSTRVEETAGGMIRDADTAMYRAKELGRNRIEVFDMAMRDRASSRLALLPDLHRAVERREFLAFLQPQFGIDAIRPGGSAPNARSERIVGAEALVRWKHPVRGLMLPAEFLSTAEEGGLLCDITEQVLEQALELLRGWLPMVSRDFAVSVNLSPTQLAEPKVSQRLLRALRAHHVAPARLCVEVTESGLMANPDASHDTLEQLSALGIRIAIDDFGTGHSSLAYLNSFPVDILKIDRSFIAAIGTSLRADALVHGIIELGQALGLATIAEGVETEQQLACLRAASATAYQGFLRNRPMPGDQMTELLRSRVPRAGSLPGSSLG